MAADKDAQYDRVIEIDLSSWSRWRRARLAGQRRDRPQIAGAKVDQVVIGSCTNSSFQDLMMVAKVLKGRRIHPMVEFGVAPGSRQVFNMLAANGALADLIAAGARILESACGPCIGQGFSPPTGR